MNKRILFVGDNFKFYTGFSYVLISLMKRFAAEGNEVAYVSITNGLPDISNLDMFETGLSQTLRGMKIYDSNIEREEMITNFNLAVTEFRPHIVISLNDPWRLPLVAYSPFRDSFMWVAYTNIETPAYPRTIILPNKITNQARLNIHEVLGLADLVIPYTKMGEAMLLSWYDREKVSSPVYNGIDLDLTDIGPVTKGEAYEGQIPESSFVFFSMGTNSPRKQMDKVIEAFYEFKKSIGNQEKYYLVMHTGSNMILNGGDLAEQIYSYGIQEYVYVTGADSLIPAEREQLYKEYSASDCYIGLPGGEGFGYGFAEAISFRKPVIYINYGGHVEYCQDCGIPVDISEKYKVKNSNIDWSLPDIKSAAAAMRRMVSDKHIYQAAVAKTEERRKEFEWYTIYKDFSAQVYMKYKEKERSNLYGIVRRSM